MLFRSPRIPRFPSLPLWCIAAGLTIGSFVQVCTMLGASAQPRLGGWSPTLVHTTVCGPRMLACDCERGGSWRTMPGWPSSVWAGCSFPFCFAFFLLLLSPFAVCLLACWQTKNFDDLLNLSATCHCLPLYCLPLPATTTYCLPQPTTTTCSHPPPALKAFEVSLHGPVS